MCLFLWKKTYRYIILLLGKNAEVYHDYLLNLVQILSINLYAFSNVVKENNLMYGIMVNATIKKLESAFKIPLI